MTSSTAVSSTTVGIVLDPLDVLFFRDGRPFTASERLLSGLPLPQTLAGAIRTALLQHLGCDFSKMRGAATFAEAVARSCGSDEQWIARTTIRGPWLARRTATDEEVDVFVPMPAILHKRKQNDRKENEKQTPLFRMSPLAANELPGWNPTGDQAGLQPLWLRTLDPTEPATGFLTQNGLWQFLQGEPVMASEVVKPDELYSLDHRTGIGISPDRLVAEESQIYGRGFLALQENVAIYAEVVLPDDAPSVGTIFDDLRTLSIGGEGRHATIRRLAHPVAWPQITPSNGQKPFVLLTTPCPFQERWKPQALAQQIVAAAVPGSIPFSGWDLANRCPKPTCFAVQAGSVYFLDSLPEQKNHSLAETEDERQLGWGCCLTGVWTDE
jgi:CRISPR-associated protein Cmr3